MNPESFLNYKDAFVSNYHKPYIIQPRNGQWHTNHGYINDKVIQAHLEQKLWAGILPPYYPKWGLLDFDNPPPSSIEQAIVKLRIQQGQYLLCTSPSYNIDGSVHLLLKPEYNGIPLTINNYRRIMDHVPGIVGGRVECFPNQGRGVRLPFGASQYLIEEDIPIYNLSWEEELYWYNKIEPVDLTIIHEYDLDKRFLKPVPSFDSEPTTSGKTLGAFYFKEGIQEFRTRHDATMHVVIWLFHQNYSPENAEIIVREWIETKHNDLSRTINKGNWAEVYRDNQDIINWVYDKFEAKQIYPDAVHNDYHAVYKCDIDFIAKTFPGEISNQKKMFRLISFFRPRMKYEWVYCPQHEWIKIAGTNQYKEFQNELIRRGILETDNSYWVKYYSKKFRLHLPDRTKSWLIESDGRTITDYREAVMVVYKTPREAIAALKIPKQTVYEWFR